MRNVTGCPTAASAVAAASTIKDAIRRAAAFASNPPMSSPGSPKRERSTQQQSVSARSFAANTFFGAGKAAEQPPLRRDGGTASRDFDGRCAAGLWKVRPSDGRLANGGKMAPSERRQLKFGEALRCA